MDVKHGRTSPLISCKYDFPCCGAGDFDTEVSVGRIYSLRRKTIDCRPPRALWVESPTEFINWLANTVHSSYIDPDTLPDSFEHVKSFSDLDRDGRFYSSSQAVPESVSSAMLKTKNLTRKEAAQAYHSRVRSSKKNRAEENFGSFTPTEDSSARFHKNTKENKKKSRNSNKNSNFSSTTKATISKPRNKVYFEGEEFKNRRDLSRQQKEERAAEKATSIALNTNIITTRTAEQDEQLAQLVNVQKAKKLLNDRKSRKGDKEKRLEYYNSKSVERSKILRKGPTRGSAPDAEVKLNLKENAIEKNRRNELSKAKAEKKAQKEEALSFRKIQNAKKQQKKEAKKARRQGGFVYQSHEMEEKEFPNITVESIIENEVSRFASKRQSDLTIESPDSGPSVTLKNVSQARKDLLDRRGLPTPNVESKLPAEESTNDRIRRLFEEAEKKRSPSPKKSGLPTRIFTRMEEAMKYIDSLISQIPGIKNLEGLIGSLHEFIGLWYLLYKNRKDYIACYFITYNAIKHRITDYMKTLKCVTSISMGVLCSTFAAWTQEEVATYQDKGEEEAGTDKLIDLLEGVGQLTADNVVEALDDVSDSKFLSRMRNMILAIVSLHILPIERAQAVRATLGTEKFNGKLDVIASIARGLSALIKAAVDYRKGASLTTVIFADAAKKEAVATIKMLLGQESQIAFSLPKQHQIGVREFTHKMATAIKVLSNDEPVKSILSKKTSTTTQSLLEGTQCLARVNNLRKAMNRVAPLALAVVSPPNRGKAHIIDLLSHAICKAMDINFDKGMVFHRNMSSEWHDGLNPDCHSIYYYSELGQTKASLVKEIGPVEKEILSLVDQQLMYANMAFDKAKFCLDPMAVICDSNDEMLGFHRTHEYVGAVFRRFWRIKPTVKDAYKKDGGGSIDAVKSVATGKPLEAWSFQFEEFDSEDGTVRVSFTRHFDNTKDFIRWFIPRVRREMEKRYSSRDALSTRAMSEFVDSIAGAAENDAAAADEERKELIEVEMADMTMIDTADDMHLDEVGGETNLLLRPIAVTQSLEDVLDQPGPYENAMDPEYTPPPIVVQLSWWDVVSGLYNPTSALVLVWLKLCFAVMIKEDNLKSALLTLLISFILGRWQGVSSLSIIFVLLCCFLCAPLIWKSSIKDSYTDAWIKQTVDDVYTSYWKFKDAAFGTTPKEVKGRTLPSTKVLLATLGGIVGTVGLVSLFLRNRKTKPAVAQDGAQSAAPNPSKGEIRKWEDLVSAGSTKTRKKNAALTNWNVAVGNFVPVHAGTLGELSVSTSRQVRAALVVRADSKANTYVFGVFGNCAIVNAHCFEGRHEPYEIIVEHSGRGATKSSGMSTTFGKGDYVPIGSDLWLIRLSGINFTDVRKHIYSGDPAITDSVMIDDFETTASVIEEMQVSNNTITKMHHNLYHYNYPGNAPGKCGLPLFGRFGSRVCIIGFHMAGVEQYGLACPIDGRRLEDAIESLNGHTLITAVSQDETILPPCDLPNPKSAFNHQDFPNVILYGKIAPSFPNKSSRVSRSPLNTGLLAGSIPDAIEEEYGVRPIKEWGAPLMKPKLIDGKYMPYNAVLEVMNKPTPSLDQKRMAYVVEVATEHIVSGLHARGITSLSPISMLEAVNGPAGDEFLRRINVSTSAGHGLPGCKSDYLPLKEDGVTRGITTPLADKIAEKLRILREGNSPPFIFNGALKDEVRSKSKIAAGKTRMFYAGALDDLIITRMILGEFFATMVAEGDLFRAAVGIDMATEAHKIAEDMHFSSKFIEWDHADFDISMIYDAAWMVSSLIYNVCKRMGYNSIALRCLKGVLTSMMYPLVSMLGDLFCKPGSTPSGRYATAEYNCLIGLVLMMYCFDDLLGDCKRFFEFVAPWFYGDDTRGSVRDLPEFNAVEIAEYYRTHYGMVITSAMKDKPIVPFLPLSETSFLKRRFVWNEEFGMWFAPLEIDSINRSLNWCIPSLTESSVKQTTDTVASALRELFFHGSTDQYRNIYFRFKGLLNFQFPEHSDYIDKTLPTPEKLIERFRDVSNNIVVSRGRPRVGPTDDLQEDDLEI